MIFVEGCEGGWVDGEGVRLGKLGAIRDEHFWGFKLREWGVQIEAFFLLYG